MPAIDNNSPYTHMVRLEVGEQTVVLKLAGSCVSVESGEGDFYGWIEADGSFNARQGTPQQVVDVITDQPLCKPAERLGCDPVAAIAKESGCCWRFYAALSAGGRNFNQAGWFRRLMDRCGRLVMMHFADRDTLR